MNMKIFAKLSTVLCFLSALIIGCTEKETQVEVSSVSLNTATVEMVEGETFSLVATVLPKDAEYDGVMWASSNASVASVNSGTVTAVKEGTATITASAGGKSATCNVKVSAKIVAVTSITLDKTSLSMQVGDTETLTATIKPEDATDKTIVWTSSDEAVVSVSNGKITALKSGKATITAKSGTCSADCVVTISVNTESIILDKTTLSLAVGESAILTATVKPDDATDKTVTWSSSDESVAKVDNGKVTAVKSGKATVTAKCGGKTAECVVTVTVPVSSILLDKTTLSLAVGESAILTATVRPDDATDKTVTWSSSDESVAKVDNGKVTALKSGKATVTAKCGGKTAECAVTVAVPVSSITLDKTTLSLAIGESATLIATVKPDDATDKTVVWSSSDESIAKVDNGKVMALKIGFAIVTATAANFSVSCNVTVTHPDNIIYYTSTDGNIVKPFNETVFGVNLITNEYYDGLGRIIFDGVVNTIGPTAFYFCKTLNTIIVPKSVKQIGKSAFQYCSRMSNIDLPCVLEVIGSKAFADCLSLQSITLPQSVTTIGSEAFHDCTKLASANIPIGVSVIEDATFANCPLTAINIPETVKYIGSSAFHRCQASEIILPESLEYIGDRAFYHAEYLEKIRIPKNVSYIGECAFSHDFRLAKVEINANISEIPYQCFWMCRSLISIEIPEGVKEINVEAFDCCDNMKSVTLPSTLKRAYNKAFGRCTTLVDVYVKAVNPPSVTFDSAMDLNIYVPRGSVELYKEKWSDKGNIIGYDF